MNIYADVLRAEGSGTYVSGVLRANQLGFADDGSRPMIYKDTASGYWNFTPDENRTDLVGIQGSGSEWYLPVWTASGSLQDSSGIYMNGYDLTIDSGTLLISGLQHATVNTDTFLVSDGASGIKYRTGAEVAAEIGAGSDYGSGTEYYLPVWTSSGTLDDSVMQSSGNYSFIANNKFLNFGIPGSDKSVHAYHDGAAFYLETVSGLSNVERYRIYPESHTYIWIPNGETFSFIKKYFIVLNSKP
jgi:hypothetical protein